MRARAAMTLAAALLPFFGSAAAEDGPPLAPPTPATEATVAQTRRAPARRAPLTRADVEAWLDGFIPYALRTGDIAGAVVVVVKDGEVLLQKGYGYSDVAARKPVDPELTLFRPGSVSKLFTWTAVMQLVEQGKLDLDADVNKYLDFEIPARDGKPITLRNIMTHTPGFEEQVKGLMGVEDEPMPAARRASEGLGSDAHLRAGHDAGVLELCDGARRLHRRARVRAVVRRLHRAAHLRAARHEALDVPPAAARAAEAVHVEGLRSSPRSRPSRSRSSARRRPAACPRPARTWRAS